MGIWPVLVGFFPITKAVEQQFKAHLFNTFENGLNTITDTEFGREIGDMVFDSAFCRAKGIGNFKVVVAPAISSYTSISRRVNG